MQIMGQPPIDQAWHAQTTEDVFRHLDSHPEGLSNLNAQVRQQQYGSNSLPPPQQKPVWLRFLLQFHNVLIYVMLAGAMITAALHHWMDTALIIAVVMVNALIGFIQEGKAEQSLAAIRTLLNDEVFVQREGQRQSIAAVELVPGDIVVLQTGDKVPADLRLFETHDLALDESLLTGESFSVSKQIAPIALTTAMADQNNKAFSGSLVTAGQGKGIVVATGAHTEIGKISVLLKEVQTLTTPLLQEIDRFGKLLTAVLLGAAVLAFVFGVWVKQYAVGEMFLISVSLLISAIPEGLPAIITITLAIGVKHMASRQALIRRLPAVETLGSVTVICSDKTGTLTRNEMTATLLCLREQRLEITGVGIDPHGDIRDQGHSLDVNTQPSVRQLIEGGLLCNDANLVYTKNQWVLQGDPTEGALVVLAHKAGLEALSLAEQQPRLDTLPFDSGKKYMATLHHNHHRQAYIYLKGAPEVVLQRCQYQAMAQQTSEPLESEWWEKQVNALANQGHRMLAIATKKVPFGCRELDESDSQGDFTLLGLIAIIDPPREEAKQAIAECRSAGIRVKMITGDHVDTARSIGAQLGIGNGNIAVTGPEVEQANEQQLQTWAQACDIFARVTPEHKLRLVQALQKQGEVVAMTGDGVNDAPALKQANIGVAMGKKGTEVAKEAAEMILMDDHFVSIVNAIKEGRVVFDNIQKSILFILPTNGGEALTILAAIALGVAMPLTPVQILWVNMVTSATLSLAFAFEPAELKIMQRSPRPPHAPILSFELVMRIGFVSLLMAGVTLGLFLWVEYQGFSLEAGRTVAINALVLCECAYLFNVRHLLKPIRSWHDFLDNRVALAAIATVLPLQIGLTYLPWAHTLLGTAPLDLVTWLLMGGAALLVFILVEIEKAIRRNRSQGTKIAAS